MRITYDKDVDVLAIFLDDSEVEETKNIAPGVEVDYDASGRVLAIEFLNASKKYDLEGEEFDPPDLYYSLAEAGEISGISPTTLRHQIERGILQGTKMGRNWVVSQGNLDAYLQERSRKANGKQRQRKSA